MYPILEYCGDAAAVVLAILVLRDSLCSGGLGVRQRESAGSGARALAVVAVGRPRVLNGDARAER